MSHPVFSEALLANAAREHPELSRRALVNHCCAKLALWTAGTLADRRAMSRGEIRVSRVVLTELGRYVIRWPEDTDNEGRASTVEIDPDVRRVLLGRRAATDGDLVFPARKCEGSISRHYADSLLRKTAEAADVALRDGEAWHAIRRRWVNDRKHLPPVDMAEAGGWSNVETMMRVYVQTDSETRLSVVLNGRDWTQSTGHTDEEESQEAA